MHTTILSTVIPLSRAFCFDLFAMGSIKRTINSLALDTMDEEDVVTTTYPPPSTQPEKKMEKEEPEKKTSPAKANETEKVSDNF